MSESIAAERAVIGACVVQPAVLAETQAILAPADFGTPQHAEVWETMRDLATKGQPCDLVTIPEELRRRGAWSALGLLASDGKPESWLIETCYDVPLTSSVRHYAGIVARHSSLRALGSALQRVSTLADSDPERAGESLLEAQRLLLASQRGRVRPGVDLADAAPRFIAEIEARAAARKAGGARVVGLSTGLSDLDFMTGGLRDETLTILAARTSLGKTAYGSQIALLGAVDSGVPALVCSLEMGADELTERFFSRLGLVESDRLRTGNLYDSDWPKLHSAAQRMTAARNLLTISNTATLAGICQEARAMRVLHQEKRIFILVDYLQLVRPGLRGRTREEELSEVSRALKGLAIELKCPVLALAQLNRGPEIEDRDPRLSDVRGSDAISHDADLVMMISRDRSALGTSSCTVHVLKQRSGALGDVHAVWDGATYQLHDPSNGGSNDGRYGD